MIIKLQPRYMRANYGQVRSWGSVLQLRHDREQWRFAKLRGIVDKTAIWFTLEMNHCECGSKGRLIADGAPHSTYSDQVRYTCICPHCGKITRPASSGTGYLYKGYVSPYNAVCKAVYNWNHKVMPGPRNPASIPLKKSFRDEITIF